MAMDAGEVERLIKARLPDAKVTIRDLVGDGDHLSARVVSQAFRGKSRVQQHQMLYEALAGRMEGLCMRLHSRRLRLRMGGVKQRQPQAKEFENP